MPESRIRRSEKGAYQRIEGEGGVLLHVESASYHQVNELGALIWELLEDEPSRSELIAALRARIAAPPDDLEDDVDEFLRALEARDLVLLDEEPAR